jgi:hypothetical protein
MNCVGIDCWHDISHSTPNHQGHLLSPKVGRFRSDNGRMWILLGSRLRRMGCGILRRRTLDLSSSPHDRTVYGHRQSRTKAYKATITGDMSSMRIICAWCDKFLGYKCGHCGFRGNTFATDCPRCGPDVGWEATHTICPECLGGIEAELEKLRSFREFHINPSFEDYDG